MAVDDLLATYSGLGTKDGEKYYKGEECLPCVKDLIRFLRDDELVSSSVRRHLGQARILQRDLLPILIHFHQEKVLRNDVLKLMLNLTLPAHIIYGNELRDRKGDVTALKCYSEVGSYLREYKEAFASAEKSIAVLVNILGEHLKEEWHSREEEDSIAVERVLVILRNILHTPVAPSEEKRTDDDCNLHDQLVWNLHSNACDQILLYLSSSPEERSLCLTVMEILFLMFRQSSPEDLVRSTQKQSKQTYNNPNKDSDILASLVEAEMHRKKQAVQCIGTRHSRFGGTYEVFSDKSISSNNRIHHASISSINTYSYDTNKRPRRKAMKFRPIEDEPSTRASISSIRKALGELALGILEHSYNPFMKSVKGRLAGDIEASFDDHYDTYYMWGIRFFMEFNRFYSFRLDLVRETLDVSIFNYLMKQIYCYQESLELEKEEQEKWGKRLHRAVSALSELFHYVQVLQCSEQHIYRENARILQSNIFYMSEFREMFPSLLKHFKPAVQTRTYLATLVDSLHLFIRLLEKFTQGGSLMVQKKGKLQRKKASKKKVVECEEPSQEQLEIEWESLQFELLRLLESDSSERDEIIVEGLFDATRPDEEENQRSEAVSRTQACLRRGDLERGVAILRAAREIWPRDDFGPRDTTCLEELERLKLIYFQPTSALAGTEEILLSEEEYDATVSEVPQQRREGEFELFPYLLKFCHHKVIHTLTFLFSHYNSNSDLTNHALVKLLHRVCYQCSKFPLLYQVSLFSVFQQILDQPNSSRFKELKVFASHVLRRFFAAARYNPCLYVEVLFWKTQDDCVDIELGYGTVDTMKKSKTIQGLWSEEDVSRLSNLWEQYKGCEAVLKEISAEISDKNEKQIKKKLINLGLAEKGDFLITKRSRKRKWIEEEDERLRELHSIYGEQEESIDSIASHFEGKSRSEVVERMLKLGIGSGGQSGGETTQNADGKRNQTRKKKRITQSDPTPESSKKKKKQPRRSLNLAATLYARVREDESLAPVVDWIENCLRTEGMDRGMDPDWDTVPIVPTNLELSQAIESSDVQDLMQALSLTAPDVGQMFWRIPSELSPHHLITCADLLSGKSPSFSEAAVNKLNSESSSDLSGTENSSCSQDASSSQTIPRSDVTQSLEQRRPGLAKLLEGKKTIQTGQSDLNREELVESPRSDGSDSDSCNLLLHSRTRSDIDHFSLPSPSSQMKASVRRLYNSDSDSDSGGHENTSSHSLHSKLQNLRATLSEDSDQEPDHLRGKEEGEGGRGKRSRLDSEDSLDEQSSQQVDRSMKKVRYIQESEEDEDS